MVKSRFRKYFKYVASQSSAVVASATAGVELDRPGYSGHVPSLHCDRNISWVFHPIKSGIKKLKKPGLDGVDKPSALSPYSKPVRFRSSFKQPSVLQVLKLLQLWRCQQNEIHFAANANLFWWQRTKKVQGFSTVLVTVDHRFATNLVVN